MVLALVLTALPGEQREAVARTIRSTVLRPVVALQQGSVERRATFADPERLRAERDSLAALMVGQTGIRAENRHLRELLGLSQRLPASFVPAEVNRIPGRAAQGFFQLTVGANDGVRVGAPVVAAEGLVGSIRNVDEVTSFGIDWMHPEFRAAAMTVSGDVYGIVSPQRGPGGEWMLALTGTPSHAELEAGEMIVTSGHGGVYPRGIPIGVVVPVDDAGTSWQRTYLVRPQVSPGEMGQVLVLTGTQPEMEEQDLATRWGIRPPEPDADTVRAAGAPGSGAAGTTAPTTSEPEPDLEPAGQPEPPQIQLPGVPVDDDDNGAGE